ncbi:MAG: hypothetical protein R2789_17900 [Microthrixaceae bacterium]
MAADGFLAAAESWRPILRRCALRSLWGAGRRRSAAGRPDRTVEILEGVEGGTRRGRVRGVATAGGVGA